MNGHLEVSRIFVKKEYGEQEAKIQSKDQLLQGEGLKQRKADQEVADHSVLGSVRYDLVGKLVEETGLTRATVAAHPGRDGSPEICHVPPQPGGIHSQGRENYQ